MTPFVADPDFTLYCGDVGEALGTLADNTVDCVVTSPPYYALRDYGDPRQIGAEPSPLAYVARLVSVFADVRRVLKPTGTLWLSLGDSFASKQNSGTGWESSTLTKPDGRPRKIQRAQEASMQTSRTRFDVPQKSLLGMPWRVAFALQDDGWLLRQCVVWSKPNPLPESVTDRPATSHEYVYLLAKSPTYFYDHKAVKEPAKWERWGRQTTPKPMQGRAAFIKPKGKNELLAEQAPGLASRRTAGFNGRWDDALAAGAIEPTRNLRSVWEIATEPSGVAVCEDCDSFFTTSAKAERHHERTGHEITQHFAAFPRKLVDTCLSAGCPPGGLVLDPFLGSGTTALVARVRELSSIGIELRLAYARMAAWQMSQQSLLAEASA